MNFNDLKSLKPGDKVQFKRGRTDAGCTATVVDTNQWLRSRDARVKITGSGEERWVFASSLTKVKEE